MRAFVARAALAHSTARIAVGDAALQAAHLLVQDRRALLGAHPRATLLVERGKVRRAARLGRCLAALELRSAPLEHAPVALRLGELGRVGLHGAPQSARLLLGLHQLLLQALFRVGVALDHLALALAAARERAQLGLDRVLGAHRRKVLVVRLALLGGEAHNLVLKLGKVDQLGVRLLVKCIVRGTQAVHLVVQRRGRRVRRLKLGTHLRQRLPQRVGRRVRRIRRRRRRTQRRPVRRRARQLRILGRHAVRRAVARLTAHGAQHGAEAAHLGAQRLDPLVLGRDERLELVDLRKLDRVARAPLKQLGIQLVTLAAQAHNVGVTRTQLLLQLVAVRVGLRRGLVLEVDTELAKLLVFLHHGGAFGTQTLRLVLQQHHVGLRLVEQGVRRDALVGQRRKLRSDAGQLLLQRTHLGTQLAQLLEPRRGQLALRHELLFERGVRRRSLGVRRICRILAPLGLGTLGVRRGDLRRLGVRPRLAERVLHSPDTGALAPVGGLLRGTQRIRDARRILLRGSKLRMGRRERGT